MRFKDKKSVWKIIFGVLAASSVIFAFALFIQDNNRRAASLSANYLKDVTKQCAQQIDEVLERAQAEIRMMASLYEEKLEDAKINYKDLRKLSEESPFDYVEFTDANGIDINAEGNTAEVSERHYFQSGMNGNSGFDVVFDSKITNENLVIFYAPLHYDGQRIGVLTGSYREDQMKEILYSTFFGESARTFLCMRDGTVISSCNGDYSPKSIFEKECFNGALDSEVEQGLRNALRAGEEYEFQYEGTAGTGNAYVMALTNSEWLLVQTFPSQVTSQMIQNANRAGIVLLVELMGIFLICLIIVQVVNLLQKKKLTLESAEKSYVVDGITQLFGTFVLVDFEQGTYRYLAGTKPRFADFPVQGSYDTLRDFILNLVEDEEERDRLAPLFEKEVLQENLDESTPNLRYEYRIKSDSEKWDSLNLICLKRTHGVAAEVLFTYQDVTKMKKREQRGYEALKEAYQAVESANQAKSNFLNNMSHDIRTPMNAIMGMTSIAAMNIEDTERVKDCLNKITVSSQHLLGLINEVLDMSKIESGKLSLAKEEFHLPDVVESIVTMFLPQTQAKNQQFKVNVVDITHEEVIGDSMRLQQIFINILGNAVKFTQDGGSITFSISEKPSAMHGCGCYVFTFEDTGIGMEESYMDKLFEPFVRADNSRASKVEGTGLGMPIVKNIVQMMNGHIQVESKLNEGSKFTITVYMKLNHSRPDDVEELKNLHVLVADDDPSACESACGMLQEIGMAADWVLSGEAAIEKLVKAHGEGKDYSVIILDWKMPGKNGIETAKEIRAEFGADIPIIILSAFDYSAVEQEARNAGINSFISKPLFRSRLVYVLKSLMRGEGEDNTELNRLQSKNYTGKRVLLVEDNEINMEIAEELLTQAGVTVDKAVNGRLAVERVHEMPAGYYDLIFMDIQMPEMNGYEAVAAIRASEREDLKTLPIVAMSADAFTDDVKHARDVGMNGHVAKPVEIEKLLNELEKWLSFDGSE